MSDQAPSRLERRKARTRAALLGAARTFIAEGRLGVPILEITQAADVGMGSFYNHFASKDELFQAAVEDALATYGEALDRLSGDLDDPAATFAQSFRLTGRLHRRHPELSRVLLHHGLSLTGPIKGLAPRARNAIECGIDQGRFHISDPELALVIAVGAALSLAQFLHDRPDRDDAAAADQIAEDLLRTFGVAADEAKELVRLPLPDLDELDVTG
jgi:AcrR family transcriptional regulator